VLPLFIWLTLGIRITRREIVGKRTALFERHQALQARIVDFAGWEMPLHYGSQLEEHHQVRRAAGVFDVSHMAIVDVNGAQAEPWLRRLLANDVARLQPGKALYSCMLNEAGGVIDDLIIYHRAAGDYRLVVNAGTREKDLAWMQDRLAGFNCQLTPRPDLAMLAVQGPQAVTAFTAALPTATATQVQDLPAFHACAWQDWFIARTGYTGEDGVEVMLPASQAGALWDTLLQAGVKPCGLGARDTLRLEAGMNLYGADMDERTTPLESGLGWTVAWEPADRDFIGRSALLAAPRLRKQVGLILLDKGVLRNHQRVQVPEGGEGEITSGGFAPTLERSIALARVPVVTQAACRVEVRGKWLDARVVKPPFVRHGRVLVDLS
jgi:aminomethyltransferase